MITPNHPSGGDFVPTHRSTSYDHISPLSLNLSGKHVLITGAGLHDGVGYATATAFARAGASVVVIADIVDIPSNFIADLQKAAKDAGRTSPLIAHSVKIDITDKESVKKSLETLNTPEIPNGRLDVLVNNAAYMEPAKPFLESDPEDYLRPYQVNVFGLHNMARTYIPLLLSSRTKDANNAGLCTMINLASSGALNARPNSGAYRSSKLAILRWTEILQVESDSAKNGLLTYCVNPGAIKTKMSEGTMPEHFRDRLPDKADIAGDTITYLAAERKEWLAGRYISCPWDMQEFEAKKQEIVEKDLLKLKMHF